MNEKPSNNKGGRPTPGDRSRKNKLEADLLEIKLKRENLRVLDREAVERMWKGICLEARQIVQQSELSLKEKAELCRLFSEIPAEKYVA